MTILIQRILLPTDFSANSATATKYACELATKYDAELHLLHTLEIHPIATPDFGMGLALPRYAEESKAAAEKALNGLFDTNWSKGSEGGAGHRRRFASEGDCHLRAGAKYRPDRHFNAWPNRSGSRLDGKRGGERGPHRALSRADSATKGTPVRNAVIGTL